MKDKMQTSGFIEDLTLADKAWSIAGFCGTLGVVRWLKKNDDLIKKVEDLEKVVTKVLVNQEHNTKSIEQLKYDVTDKEGYVHTMNHDLVELINTKTMKENVMNDIDDKMNEILNKLNK